MFDEDVDSDKTETRHKLADIYHANINIVRPDEADATAKDVTTNYLKKKTESIPPRLFAESQFMK